MPLRAIRPDGSDILAFLACDDEWEAIRAARGKHGLTMPNGVPAVAKVSKRGTRFFAHKSGHGTQTAPESREHLEAKAIIAMAAHAAGWNVQTEASGKSPDQDEWRADVLCWQGSTRVAFEVQWSRQTDEEMRRRQAVYAASGIRALWLVRLFGRHRMSMERYQIDFPKTDRECPAFGLRESGTHTGFDVVMDVMQEAADCRRLQVVELREFIESTLSGYLKWWCLTDWLSNCEAPIALCIRDMTCWACNYQIAFPSDYSLVTPGIVHSNVTEPIDGLCSDVKYAFLTGTVSELRKEITWMTPMERVTKSEKTKIMGVCPACGARISPWYVRNGSDGGKQYGGFVIAIPAPNELTNGALRLRSTHYACPNPNGWVWSADPLPATPKKQDIIDEWARKDDRGPRSGPSIWTSQFAHVLSGLKVVIQDEDADPGVDV